jgi:hypothetical protein
MDELIFVNLAIPRGMLTSVYALLGASSVGLANPAPAGKPTPAPANVAASTPSAPSPSAETAGTVSTPVAATSSETPPSDPNDVDTGGWPWSADMHASTKAKTGAGLWRMKPGVARPENKPGFTGSADKPVSAEPATTTPSAAPVAAVAAVADEDEFAAFRAAAEVAPAAAPAARTWTDADLSKLCNQAAVAKGSPEPVKAIIAKYVPDGEVPHSRSIPTDQREAFASEVENTLGLKYEG